MRFEELSDAFKVSDPLSSPYYTQFSSFLPATSAAEARDSACCSQQEAGDKLVILPLAAEPCMAAQALISSTTAPPLTSSGRWNGQWTLYAGDLLD
jgi:hypothetical protein